MQRQQQQQQLSLRHQRPPSSAPPLLPPPRRSIQRCRSSGASAPQQQQQQQQQLGGVQVRTATAADVPVIRRTLLGERMNPLALHPERFTVAVETAAATCPSSGGGGGGGAAVVGFAQLAPLGGDGAGKRAEFRSLVVAPSHRGRGVGGALLARVVAGASPGAELWLTTLRRTAPFYERAGFAIVPLAEVPRELWFEAVAGTVVARLAAGDELVVMVRRPSM